MNPKKDLGKPEKRFSVPEYHFYENKDILIELFEKEDEYNFARHIDPNKEPLT